MVNVKIGKCDVCKKRGELTQHEVVEAPKDEQGRIRAIMICDNCHTNYNKYKQKHTENKNNVRLAQLVLERGSNKPKVAGSSPAVNLRVLCLPMRSASLHSQNANSVIEKVPK